MRQRWVRLLNGSKTGVVPSLLRALLWMASQPYSLLITLRNWAYDRRWLKVHSADVPVISVGNLTVGGTGKSPVVLWLAKWFRSHNVRVSIVSRGYRPGLDGLNDEAKEMETRLPDVPQVQNPDRVAAAKVACEELETELIVCDDAFQHRRLHRDLNLLVIDATEPFGYEFLLPRGLLREPIRALRRVDVVIVTRANQVDSQSLANIRTRVQRYAPKAAWVETEHRPLQFRNASQRLGPIDSYQQKRVIAFCGLGNPKGFFDTLRSIGCHLIEEVAFPDHHHYVADDIQALIEIATQTGDIAAFLCTGKDLAKIDVDTLGEIPLWSLDIELHILNGIEPLEDRLEEIRRMIPAPQEETFEP